MEKRMIVVEGSSQPGFEVYKDEWYSALPNQVTDKRTQAISVHQHEAEAKEIADWLNHADGNLLPSDIDSGQERAVQREYAIRPTILQLCRVDVEAFDK